MKLKTKKIIAREFLTLIIVFSIGLIIFLGTYPYNAYKDFQIERQKNEIFKKTELADSLSLSFKTKLSKKNWLFKNWVKSFDLSDDDSYNTLEKLWSRLDYLALKDSINYKWHNVWDEDIIAFTKSLGFSNPEIFQSFLNKNRITKIDLANNDSSKLINSEIVLLSKSKNKNKEQVLSYKEQTELGLKSLVFCFMILFGLRYLFYSLKWSIKTLKQN